MLVYFAHILKSQKEKKKDLKVAGIMKSSAELATLLLHKVTYEAAVTTCTGVYKWSSKAPFTYRSLIGESLLFAQ